MLSLSDFKPVSLNDRDVFVQHYKRFPQVHSDNTFTNMVCWNHYAHYHYANVEDSIIISTAIDGVRRYRPPIGPRIPELLAEVIELASRSNDEIPLSILDPKTKDWIMELYPGLSLYPERKYFEYVYRADDLANLPGKRYLSIRHQLNQFTKKCSPAVVPMTEVNAADVIEFLDLWCDWKDCDSDPMLANEKEAVNYAIYHFAELELSGLAIIAEGKIGAIAVFEGLNEDTALVHFEKGLPDCKGIYRAINAETAKLLSKDYIYINRESDLGVEGIREAKMRYHPDHMVEVYFAKREDLMESRFV